MKATEQVESIAASNKVNTGHSERRSLSNRRSSRVEIGLEFSTSLTKLWGTHFPLENLDPTERKRAASRQRPSSAFPKGSSR